MVRRRRIRRDVQSLRCCVNRYASTLRLIQINVHIYQTRDMNFMYDPANRNITNLAFLWPAFVATSANDMAAFIARQFTSLAVGRDGTPQQHQKWATPHRIALDLETVQLRDFSTEAKSFPALLCAPLALHGAAVSDLAPGHSLVAALRNAGLKRGLAFGDRQNALPRHRRPELFLPSLPWLRQHFAFASIRK